MPARVDNQTTPEIIYSSVCLPLQNTERHPKSDLRCKKFHETPLPMFEYAGELRALKK